MMKYESQKIIQSQKQYEMLKNSLRFMTNEDEIKDICNELNRIEENILNLTNEEYEKVYMQTLAKKADYMDEERERIHSLIELIEERLAYLEKRRHEHKEITGLIAKQPITIGEDELPDFKKKISTIDKYEKNVKLIELLTKEIASLGERINNALEKMQSNATLNEQLEKRMISLFNESFRKLDLYSLPERSKEINLAYNELEFSLSKASDNLMKAKKTSNNELILECESMLKAASEDFNHYKEKKTILKLLEIYDLKVQNYDELVKKREEINDLLRSISGSELYKLVFDEINKQYNTIKIESQDVKTYTTLTEDKEKKSKLLYEIEEENSSEEFLSSIKEIIENERRKKEQEEEERRKHEEEILRQKQLEEKKRQEEILKRQKQLEEKRKKEIEERTRILLSEKQKSVINNKVDNQTRSHSNTSTNIFKNELPSKELETPSLPRQEIPKKELKLDSPVNKQEYSFFDKLIEETKTQTNNKTQSKVSDEKANTNPSQKESINDDSKENLFMDLKKASKELPENPKPEPQVEEKTVSRVQKNAKTNVDAIPVIQNNKLVPEKVDEEVIKQEEIDKRFKEDSKPLEDFSVEDIIFPEMPM